MFQENFKSKYLLLRAFPSGVHLPWPSIHLTYGTSNLLFAKISSIFTLSYLSVYCSPRDKHNRPKPKKTKNQFIFLLVAIDTEDVMETYWLLFQFAVIQLRDCTVIASIKIVIVLVELFLNVNSVYCVVKQLLCCFFIVQELFSQYFD